MEYTIEAFVDELLQEKGIVGLSDDVIDQMRSDLLERAESLINANILAAMPEAKLEEFEHMLDSATTQDIQVFCRHQIPNIDQVIGQSLQSLKNMYLQNV